MTKEVEFKNRDRFIEHGLNIAFLRKIQGMSQEKLVQKQIKKETLQIYTHRGAA